MQESSFISNSEYINYLYQAISVSLYTAYQSLVKTIFKTDNDIKTHVWFTDELKKLKKDMIAARLSSNFVLLKILRYKFRKIECRNIFLYEKDHNLNIESLYKMTKINLSRRPV
jgi:hypothetical protein